MSTAGTLPDCASHCLNESEVLGMTRAIVHSSGRKVRVCVNRARHRNVYSTLETGEAYYALEIEALHR